MAWCVDLPAVVGVGFECGDESFVLYLEVFEVAPAVLGEEGGLGTERVGCVGGDEVQRYCGPGTFEEALDVWECDVGELEVAGIGLA